MKAVLPHRFAVDRNEFFEGAPSAVVEIHSPEDESYALEAAGCAGLKPRSNCNRHRRGNWPSA